MVFVFTASSKIRNTYTTHFKYLRNILKFDEKFHVNTMKKLY